MKDAIGVAVACLLAGLGIAFRDSLALAIVLIFFAVFALVYVGVRSLIRHIPTTAFRQYKSKKAMEQLYDEAADYGGRLIATHIRPWRKQPPDDYALRALRKVKHPLSYQRFVLIEDRHSEDAFVRSTLEKLDPRVSVSVYTVPIKRLIDPSFWVALPRANMLLYNRGNKYISLLGLDHLHHSEPRYQNVNFSVCLRSKEAFETLERYFESLTVSRHVVCNRSLREYDSRNQRYGVFQPKPQSVLLELVEVAYQSAEVLHIGLFGRKAQVYAGKISATDGADDEADLDILFVVNPGCTEAVRQKIKSSMEGREGVEVVWGDDPDYFYRFRDPGSLCVDIEIFERGSEFYLTNKLLAHSIFAFYQGLYWEDNTAAVQDLLPLPGPCASMQERFELVLRDRKGLRDFTRELERRDDSVDPRRVGSHCVRNVSWALGGSRPATLRDAIEVLRQESNYEHVVMVVGSLVSLGQEVVRSNYSEHRAECVELVRSCTTILEDRLRER